MADVLTINGSAVNLAAANATLDRCTPLVKGGFPELHFSRLLGTLKPPAAPALPDAWSAQPCTLTVSGTLIFAGVVQGYVDRYMQDFGWLREYRALGLRNSADYVPVTDVTTQTDTAVFNLPGDDPNFVGARAGLTVGAIVGQLLTMATNAGALSAAGVGAYTTLGPPAVLPALTVSDLAALTVIPPWRVIVSGERILQALEEFIRTCHPNHWLHVQPDGTIRFLDARLPTNNTLTLGADPRLGMPQLTRDYSDSYSQVEVRGNTQATAVTLQTNPWPGSSSTDGGLQEDFAWGGHTNAAAKLLWNPSDYNQPSINGASNDLGSCTCPDTTHVIVTDSAPAATWSVNFWSQANAQGQIYLYADTITGVAQFFSARIVANTALTAGGTSTLTLDRALPNVSFNSYQIWGLSENASVVYRRYKVSNAAIGAALMNYFPYPVAIRLAVNSAAASLTSTPAGFYQYSPTGGTSPPFNLSYGTISIDPVNGLVYFDRPTAVVAGTTVVKPVNVIVFLPVATGTLSAFAPSSSGHAGTLFTVEAVSRTKIITVRDWLDGSNQTTMNTFASEFLDSVKDVVVEGSLPYQGLLSTYLTCGATGQAVSIAGSSYTTGWESLALPVVGVELVFNCGPEGTSYQTNLALSNRRGRYTADQFLRPGVTQIQLGGGDGNAIAAGGIDQQAEMDKHGTKDALASNTSTIAGANAQREANMPVNAPSPTSNLPAAWNGSMPGFGMSREAARNQETDAIHDQTNRRDRQERQAFNSTFGALPNQNGGGS
jgi:hypothetical protein